MALVVPVINYSWKSLPENLTRLDFRRKLVQWTLWLANYAPELLYWWVTREWLPSTTFLEKNPTFFSDRDIDVLKKTPEFPMLTKVLCISNVHVKVYLNGPCSVHSCSQRRILSAKSRVLMAILSVYGQSLLWLLWFCLPILKVSFWLEKAIVNRINFGEGRCSTHS